VTGPTVTEATSLAGEELVERERELARLRKLRDRVRADGGRVVMIEGSAGIGKTRLLAAMRTLAGDDGWTVLAARGAQMPPAVKTLAASVIMHRA
jgi:ATP/maltotriose-dependent transcriptional regulator MalT